MCFGVGHVQDVTGLWCAIQAQNLNRDGWTRLFDAVALVINQRTYFAVLLTHNKDVALTQCTVLNQHSCNGTTAHIKLRLDYSANCGTVRVRFQLKNLCLQCDGLKQLIQTLASCCRHFDILNIAGHLFHDHFMLQKIRAHLVRIGRWFVDFVDRHDHRYLGGFGVVNRFDRLWHHGVISSDHQNNNVSYLCAA